MPARSIRAFMEAFHIAEIGRRAQEDAVGPDHPVQAVVGDVVGDDAVSVGPPRHL
jgi:hypothetical protein